MNFLCLNMNIFIFLHYGLHSLNVTQQVTFISFCVHYVKRNMTKSISGPKKGMTYYFPQCFSYVFFILAKRLFICVPII
jgi:hypothetical protein